MGAHPLDSKPYLDPEPPSAARPVGY